MSVPVWLIILSDQLTIAALGGRYPTNKLMVRGLISKQKRETEAPFHYCNQSRNDFTRY